MFERNISTDDLFSAIKVSEIIESYPDDEPCPSLLMLGFILRGGEGGGAGRPRPRGAGMKAEPPFP
jgi:hypothetical protein